LRYAGPAEDRAQDKGTNPMMTAYTLVAGGNLLLALGYAILALSH
jgi:hypothetical protein